MRLVIVGNEDRFAYAAEYQLIWFPEIGLGGADATNEELRTEFERLILEARLRGEL